MAHAGHWPGSVPLDGSSRPTYLHVASQLLTPSVFLSRGYIRLFPRLTGYVGYAAPLGIYRRELSPARPHAPTGSDPPCAAYALEVD